MPPKKATKKKQQKKASNIKRKLDAVTISDNDGGSIKPTYIVDTTGKYDAEYDRENPLGKMLKGAPEQPEPELLKEIDKLTKRAETAEEELRVLRLRLQPFKYQFTMNNMLISVMVRPRTCEIIPLNTT